ncbi:hypothetical protein [Rhodopseudomonas palustris]|uniref:Uncharacterized protein n=1 Tax=Rhodopseudomonas palustris (strain BisB18) TaxID=316056 RepID=Q219Q2_RHOPB
MSLFGKRTSFEVPCTVEIEQTSESLHAHVILDGDIEIRPGDEVTVHDAPTDIGFGEHIVVRRTATVVRAGLLEGLRARLEGYLELTELYEVSFSNGRVS